MSQFIALIDERIFPLLCEAVSARGASFRTVDILDPALSPGERLERRAALHMLFARMGLESQPPLTVGTDWVERRLCLRETPNEWVEEVRRLIGQGEVSEVEFKSSLYFSHDAPEREAARKNLALRDEVLKSVCAYLNASGGTVLVGVSNRGVVLGIEHDFRTDRDWPTGSEAYDKWIEVLMSEFVNFSNPDAARSRVDVRLVELSIGRTVAVIKVRRYTRFMSVKVKNRQGCEVWAGFVRRGNSSPSLRPHEIEDYVLLRLGLSSTVGVEP